MSQSPSHANDGDPNFAAILNYYKKYFKVDMSEYEKEKAKIVFPIVPLQVLRKLCDTAQKLFKAEPALLRLNGDTLIIGDLHGHIFDLFRTLGKLGLPPNRTYLFLGDLVDRGHFSTETVVLILTMKVIWPEHVFLIRGNHEFADMAKHGGFFAELSSLYNTRQAEEFIMKAFSYMPLAAIIGGNVLCVHGGLGPSLNDIKQLEEIQRPLNDYNDDLIQGLLWSDPAQFLDTFQESSRGIGYFFGHEALSSFLDSNKLQYMVRGHECVEKGIEAQLNRRMFTVFGASNYCGRAPNKSGVLLIHPDGSREACFFNPITYIKRANVSFVASESDTVFKPKRPGLPTDPKRRSFQKDSLPALHPGRKSEAKLPEIGSGRPQPQRVQSEFRKTPLKKLPVIAQPRRDSMFVSRPSW